MDAAEGAADAASGSQAEVCVCLPVVVSLFSNTFGFKKWIRQMSREPLCPPTKSIMARYLTRSSFIHVAKLLPIPGVIEV